MASGGSIIKTQHFDVPKDAPKYVGDMMRDIGLQEWVLDGKRKRVQNPAVRRLVQDGGSGTSFNVMTQPWCAWGLNGYLKRNGYSGTGSGMARSFERWGIEIDRNDDSKWRVGDIAVQWRGRSNDGVTGHVYVILYWDRNYIYGLGCNQGDKVCIERQPRAKLLSVRRYRSIFASKTAQKSAGSAASEAASQVADQVIPDPSAAHPIVNHIDNAAQAAQQLQDPLSVLAQWKPWITGVLSAIAIALALWAAYHRYVDHKEGYNV